MKVILIWFNNKHKALCFWRIREKENWKLLCFFYIYNFFCQINKPIFITYWLLSVDIHDSKKEKKSVFINIHCGPVIFQELPTHSGHRRLSIVLYPKEPGAHSTSKRSDSGPEDFILIPQFMTFSTVSPVFIMCITCGQCEFALNYNDNRASVADLRVLMFSSECQLSCMVLGW